jgi:hypothetical protein
MLWRRSLWPRQFSWRVEVTISPQSENERRHAIVIVKAGDRAAAAVKALRQALAMHPHKIWRDLTLSVMPDV